MRSRNSSSDFAPTRLTFKRSKPPSDEMHVSVIEAGHDEMSAEVDHLGVAVRFSFQNLGILPDGFDAISADGNRLRALDRL